MRSRKTLTVPESEDPWLRLIFFRITTESCRVVRTRPQVAGLIADGWEATVGPRTQSGDMPDPLLMHELDQLG
jgi:hypothetical protein